MTRPAAAEPKSGAGDRLASAGDAPCAVQPIGIPLPRTATGAPSAPATAPEAVSTVAAYVALRGKASQDAWHGFSAVGQMAVAEAIRVLAASACGCCGQRWGLRALAARLDREIPSDSGRPRYGGALAHSTLSRIARRSSSYGQRVDAWTYRSIGRAIVLAFGTAEQGAEV